MPQSGQAQDLGRALIHRLAPRISGQTLSGSLNFGGFSVEAHDLVRFWSDNSGFFASFGFSLSVAPPETDVPNLCWEPSRSAIVFAIEALEQLWLRFAAMHLFAFRSGP
jgi:hypothetical protein